MKKLFKQIESIEFAVNFSVISGYNIFRIALENDSILRDLIEKLRKQPANTQKVFERLIWVLESENTSELLHPQDIAIAAYLYVLSKVDMPTATIAAQRVSGTENLWWSKRLAASVQESVRSVATATIETGNWIEGDAVEVRQIYSAPSLKGHIVNFPSPRNEQTTITYSAPSTRYEERVS